jgi:AAA15 family ATPase/GTPase
MLIQLTVTNFRSIKEPTTLSMIPLKYKEHTGNVFSVGKVDLLKSAVIYGANASGKSNLLKAFRALQYLIVESTNLKLEDVIPPYEPFKLDPNLKNAPVSIEMDFIAQDGIRYNYIVSYTSKEIQSEELSFYPKNQKSRLFLREKGSPIIFGDYYRGDRKTIESQLLDNQLFLSKGANSNVEQLKPVYLYFKEKLSIVPFLYNRNENQLTRLFASRLAKDKNSIFSKKFKKLICAFDTGINDIHVEEVDPNKVKFPENVPLELRQEILNEFKFDIRTVHKSFNKGQFSGDVYFDIKDESVGTRSLFSIAGLILDTLEHGGILIIDEFEKNLHPIITKFLIKLFHNTNVNNNKSQLIFATHDISQLDNDTFRRDQIWFTEKNEFGATELISLSDIKGVRDTVPYDKWYESGRLGGTPIINELDFILENEASKN